MLVSKIFAFVLCVPGLVLPLICVFPALFCLCFVCSRPCFGLEGLRVVLMLKNNCIIEKQRSGFSRDPFVFLRDLFRIRKSTESQEAVSGSSPWDWQVWPIRRSADRPIITPHSLIRSVNPKP